MPVPRTRAASSLPASSWPTTTVSSSPATSRTTPSACCALRVRTRGHPAVARLVLPEGHYGKLAEHLGLPANWPMNQ